ncbi:MAG: hypothetical protein JXB05_38135 [Myxococcaceae bacterium]|nr:hypothetical protein [Myxococcaceae bacterium]
MKKCWVLAACLIAGAAWAQPVEELLLEARAPERPAPSVALWTEPLSALTVTPWYYSQENTFVMVPLGANLPLSPTQDLVLELTPLWTRQDCEARCSSQALALAIGTSWLVSPNGSGGGLFLHPKLVGVISRDRREAGLPTPIDEGSWSETGGQLSLGLDVGYRVSRGRLFLEFVLGASVGRGWNIPLSSQSLFFSFLDWPQRGREDKWVWDLNVHLVRIGVSF